MKTFLKIPPHGQGILTSDNLIFLTWGRVLFGGSPIYVLKYIPAKVPSNEARTFNGRQYLKVKSPLYHYAEMIDLLKKTRPQYVRRSEYFGIDSVHLSESSIARKFLPTEAAKSILSNPKDDLERKFAECYGFFSDNFERIDIGITASLMFGIHTTSSDMDVMIYTNDAPNTWNRLFELIMDGSIQSCLLENQKEKASVEQALNRPVDKNLFERLITDKRYLGALRIPKIGGECHLMIVPKELKTIEERPQMVYYGEVKGKVIDDSEAIFSVPEFIISDDDGKEYKVICYHKGGELVRVGDEVCLRGIFMRFEGCTIIVMLDPIKHKISLLNYPMRRY